MEGIRLVEIGIDKETGESIYELVGTEEMLELVGEMAERGGMSFPEYCAFMLESILENPKLAIISEL